MHTVFFFENRNEVGSTILSVSQQRNYIPTTTQCVLAQTIKLYLIKNYSINFEKSENSA